MLGERMGVPIVREGDDERLAVFLGGGDDFAEALDKGEEPRRLVLNIMIGLYRRGDA